ncbi:MULTISPECIES: mercury resistance system periplasmic binding protein MerP [Alteromonadaceae]|uniref:Periplasmic mercury ion-binding protein n=1 Tax=Glaciecola petra TaxID=3075602 RepID=A0ABU2ZT96_9ALTE|nr:MULTISPECIES: mercury resistance system periplasmic binding protein MerP [Alteromonadaceae]MDT0595539.1 mercury resistance system periplasmic binding protein MerP [Aestuariibacter sp. P117]MDT0627121.1 mercury resistance system periplasmic binding protein MerP [Alteromonas sp. W364]
MKKLLFTSLLLVSSTEAFAKDITVTLEVPSMDCATCPITVEKALERVKGVKEVDVTFENKLAVVIFDDEVTSPDALTKATENAGFPSRIKS